MATEITQKNSKIFTCELCHFLTCNKNDYNRHNLTQKHIRNISATFSNNFATEKTHECGYCGKPYKDRTGLWRHKKKCSSSGVFTPQPEKINKDEIIIMLLKQNAELIKGQQDVIIKLTENGTTNICGNTTTHTNSHNKAFNLNFFLNETCKNAMNITDFVDSIKLQLSDLMDVGELGYVDGISKIIVNKLNNLDETERPIHCTDKKRETFYVKDQDQWEKDDENKCKLKKAVKKVANKNIRLLAQFREKYPEYSNSTSKISDTHDKIVVEAMTCDDNKDLKIIKNISKATGIREN